MSARCCSSGFPRRRGWNGCARPGYILPVARQHGPQSAGPTHRAHRAAIDALAGTVRRIDVEPTVLSPLVAWESFYVIVGSSGAALTGLQFVVIALVAESRAHSSSREIAAFGTPTVVHFSAVLFLSAALSAPWRTLSGPAIVLGCGGILGVAYTVVVVIRARAQTSYRPVLEDWLWHVVFPFIAYATLITAAVSMRRHL